MLINVKHPCLCRYICHHVLSWFLKSRRLPSPEAVPRHLNIEYYLNRELLSTTRSHSTVRIIFTYGLLLPLHPASIDIVVDILSFWIFLLAIKVLLSFFATSKHSSIVGWQLTQDLEPTKQAFAGTWSLESIGPCWDFLSGHVSIADALESTAYWLTRRPRLFLGPTAKHENSVDERSFQQYWFGWNGNVLWQWIPVIAAQPSEWDKWIRLYE